MQGAPRLLGLARGQGVVLVVTIIPSPEQQAIIDYPLAPLRVTAGAGTGKTTTAALRIGKLVADGQVVPEAALGVTFTNKAAAELGDRIREELGELVAEGRAVEVTTYHGFAHALLQEFGAAVGVERDAGIVTPGYTRQLLRDAIGSGSYVVLDITAAAARVDDLAGLAGRLGDHLRTAQDLVAAAPASEDRNTVWAQRVELAGALARYRNLKRDLGVVDYADLITLANDLLDRRPDLANEYRRRYRLVLLDEYQDTNPAQRLLLQKIFGAGVAVTAVGDPDQTIYEWRGASLENFERFPTHFPDAAGEPAATLPLSLNRRSGQRIIDLANSVRKHIATDSGLDELRARTDAPGGDVAVGWFRTAVSEARRIAEEIRTLHDQEDVAWAEMAVLFRKNRQIALVRDALEEQGVPLEVAALGGLLDVPEVNDVHAWLRILGSADDSPALVRILVGSRFRLGFADLSPLADWVRKQQRGDDEDEPLRWSLLEAIDQLDDISGLSEEAARRFREFLALYRELLQAAQVSSLVELCRRIIDATGAWPEVEALDDAARLSARLNLYRFLDLAEAWSPLEGRPSLQAFLEYLLLLQDDDAAQELDTARLGSEDAVALVTVHRAKGLEWPVVFLPALCKDTFPSSMRRRDDPSRFAALVPFELRVDGAQLGDLPTKQKDRDAALGQRHMAQEWRTAYVAVTRAKRLLYCTGAYWYSERLAKERSELFNQAAGMPGVTVLADHQEPGEAPATLRLNELIEGSPDPHFDGDWRTALRATLDDPDWPEQRARERSQLDTYHAHVEQLEIMLDGLPAPLEAAPEDDGVTTSVSGLVTYATCPQRFRWSEVDRLPRAPSASRRRGVEIHRRIELYNRGAVAFEEAEEEFYDIPEGEAGETHEVGRSDPFETFRSSRFAEQRPIFTEVPFDLKIEAARVRGRIDAIYEPEPGLWEIVDFKTGRARVDPARTVQLQAYAVATTDVDFTPNPPERTAVTFAYLGNGLEEITQQVDDAWLQDARRRLGELIDGVEAADFAPTPSPACHSCDFLRFCDDGKAWVEANQ